MKIAVLISKETALLAGSNEYGQKCVHVDAAQLTPEQRATLLRVQPYVYRPSGADFSLIERMFSDSFKLNTLTEPTPAGVIALLDQLPALLDAYEVKRRGEREENERRAAEAERQLAESRERVYQEFAANPAARASSCTFTHANYRGVVFQSPHPMVELAYQRLRDDQEKERVEKERATTAKAEQERQEKEFLHAWVVRESGDANMIARQEADLLGRSEVLERLRDAIFAPLVVFPRFRRITQAECCKENCQAYEPGKDFACRVYVPDSVTSEEWNHFQRMLAVVKDMRPEITLVFKLHVCEVSCCEGEVERVGIVASTTAGPFTLTREYAAEEICNE